MSEVDNAASAPALDDEAVSSAEETTEVVEGQEPEQPEVNFTENAQKRFDQITGERNQEREAKEALAAQNADLQSRLAALESQGLNLDYQDPGAPKEDDFENPDDYLIAKGAHEATKNVVGMIQAGEQQRAEALRQQQLNGKIMGYNQKLTSVKTQLEDFDLVTSQGVLRQQDPTGQLTPAAEALLEVDHGPEAFYHIQKNPNLAMQLNMATPAQAAILVKSISDQFASSPNVNEPPPPVQSEGPSGGLGEPNDDPLGLLNGVTFE